VRYGYAGLDELVEVTLAGVTLADVRAVEELIGSPPMIWREKPLQSWRTISRTRSQSDRPPKWLSLGSRSIAAAPSVRQRTHAEGR